MATALIFAGGTGQRLSTRAKPKQFLELHGKPIIIYTLEHFEKHSEIDDIIVVCLESWIGELRYSLKKYDFEKISRIVPGGDRGDISIYNGLKALVQKQCSLDEIVLIHDGVRPLINCELISKVIATVKEKGNAITAEEVFEHAVLLDDNGCVKEVPPREATYLTKAPHGFRFGMIWDLYQKARKNDVVSYGTPHLCSIYDVEMNIVKSTPNNIKVTVPADYYIFRALYEAMENEQILGM